MVGGDANHGSLICKNAYRRQKKWLAGTQTMDQMVGSIIEKNGWRGRKP